MAGEPIKIDLERSGGFAGVTLRASVDTAKLPAAEADQLAGLLARVDLDELARRPSGIPTAPDRFQYDLTVTRGGRRQHVTFGERAVTPELRPLLNRLVELARRR